jgi:hypothetical protein
MLGKTRAPVRLRFARAGVAELSVSVHRLRRIDVAAQGISLDRGFLVFSQVTGIRPKPISMPNICLKTSQ